MITTIIFDLDGLLAETEIHHMTAYQTVLSKHGYDISDEEYRHHWIRDGKTIRDLVKKHNIPYSPQELHNQKVKLYKQKIENHVEPCEGAIKFLESVKNKFRSALATNSYRDYAQIVIDRLNMSRYFEVFICRDDIAELKPNPEIFLKAASVLKVSPAECVVLEDAQKGIEAADAAGMKSVAIPNKYTFDNDFSKATLVLKSLKELTPEIIKSLI